MPQDEAFKDGRQASAVKDYKAIAPCQSSSTICL